MSYGHDNKVEDGGLPAFGSMNTCHYGDYASTPGHKHCIKCGHSWEPRNKKEAPKRCPRCKNTKYWQPKKPGIGRPKGSGKKQKQHNVEILAADTADTEATSVDRSFGQSW